MGSSRFDVMCSCFTMGQANFGHKLDNGGFALRVPHKCLGCHKDHDGYILLMSLCGVKTWEIWGQVDLMPYVYVSQWGNQILDRNYTNGGFCTAGPAQNSWLP